MSTISDRLREERLRLDLVQPEMADLGGVGKQSQINYESGKRQPDADYLSRIAAAGADVAYILTGKRTVPALPVIDTNVGLTIRRHYGPVLDLARQATGNDVSAVEERGDGDLGEEYARIPLYDARLAAGSGQQNDHEQITSRVAFRHDWLKQVGIHAATAVLARAEGDSMEPAIYSGDLILIDRSRSELPVRQRLPQDTRPASIYAILIDGMARVKRIERPAEEVLLLMSDNPAYGPEFLTGSAAQTITIIGEVVWSAHTWRE